ncbi:MAG TPA: hypothetical protein VFB62_00015 [Polyangiaceae bacterium]|jgi:hypothetical protein|nr:hypothetical protein [Polyangiaceae bacterium]
MTHLPLTLERFAALQAEIDAGGVRDALLAREKLSLDTWLAAQRGWFALMAAELKKNRFDISQRYAALYGEAQPELVGLARDNDGQPASSDELNETVAAMNLNIRNVLPFGVAQTVDGMDTLDDTEDADTLQPDKKSAEKPLPAATPFEARHPKKKSEVEKTPPVAVVKPLKSEIDSTAEALVLNLDDALPFKPGEAVAPPLAAPQPDLSGATMFASSGDFSETLPFQRGGASESKVTVEGWTVEHYASLCVELERGERSSVLQRYRIDEAKRQALERQWNDKFSTSTRLARLFLKARARYLEWLELHK